MSKVIACMDHSEYADDVCKAAVWAAKNLQQPLLFIHALEKELRPQENNLSGVIGLGARTALLSKLTELDEQRSRLALQAGRELLESAQQYARDQGLQQVDIKQQHGKVLEFIGSLADTARTIVLGRSTGHNRLADSHVEQILRSVRTPVLISSLGFNAPRSFMFAYDGRDTADRIAHQLAEGSLLKGLDCHLVSVRSKTAAQEEKLAATRKLLENSGYRVTARLLEGEIFPALQGYAKEQQVDLLVMGTFSRSKLMRTFLGSNTARMIGQTNLPLVIFH